MRCVALKGRQPGLGVDAHGDIVWHSDRPLGCELWVSADEQLILLRPSGAPGVIVERAGRSLDAPFDKPVVLLDQDTIELAGRRFRVHVHGTARAVSPPTPLVERQGVGRLAATVALGVAALSCQKTDPTAGSRPVEVRETPPSAAPLEPPDAAVPVLEDAAVDAPVDSPADAGGEAGKADAGKKKPKAIEVRNHPPDPIE